MDDIIEREIQAKGLTAARVTPQRIEEVTDGLGPLRPGGR